jgi:hypothetical protein
VLAAAALATLPSPVAGALLGVACLPLAVRAPGARIAGFVAVGACVLVTLAAAGVAVQSAFDGGGADPGVVRLAVASAVAVAIVLLARRRLRGRALSEGTVAAAAVLVAGGALLGLPLSLRPFVDPWTPSPSLLRDVVAVAGLAAAVLVARRAPPRAGDRLARLAVVACAAVVFLGGRAMEHAGGEGFAAARASRGAAPAALGIVATLLLATGALRRPRLAPLVGLAAASAAFALGNDAQGAAFVAVASLSGATLVAAGASRDADARLVARCLAVVALGRLLSPSDAAAALLAVFALGCRAAGALAPPRTAVGAAGLAVAAVAARAALFHALGHAEDLSTVDVAAGFAAWGEGVGAARVEAAGPSAEVVLAVLLLGLRFALPWVAVFAAAARAFGDDRRGPARLLGDVSVAYAARAAAVLLVLSVWWRSAWWIGAAVPTFLFAGAEVLLAGVGFALAAGGARAPESPRVGRAREALPTPAGAASAVGPS